MIISTNILSSESSAPGMSAWLSVLQENAKSEIQLQTEMINGVTETIEEMKEKREEQLEEEKVQNSENAVSVELSSGETISTSETPSSSQSSTVDFVV